MHTQGSDLPICTYHKIFNLVFGSRKNLPKHTLKHRKQNFSKIYQEVWISLLCGSQYLKKQQRAEKSPVAGLKPLQAPIKIRGKIFISLLFFKYQVLHRRLIETSQPIFLKFCFLCFKVRSDKIFSTPGHQNEDFERQ